MRGIIFLLISWGRGFGKKDAVLVILLIFFHINSMKQSTEKRDNTTATGLLYNDSTVFRHTEYYLAVGRLQFRQQRLERQNEQYKWYPKRDTERVRDRERLEGGESAKSLAPLRSYLSFDATVHNIQERRRRYSGELTSVLIFLYVT
jgi:hypothetical protein